MLSGVDLESAHGALRSCKVQGEVLRSGASGLPLGGEWLWSGRSWADLLSACSLRGRVSRLRHQERWSLTLGPLPMRAAVLRARLPLRQAPSDTAVRKIIAARKFSPHLHLIDSGVAKGHDPSKLIATDGSGLKLDVSHQGPAFEPGRYSGAPLDPPESAVSARPRRWGPVRRGDFIIVAGRPSERRLTVLM